ncbi:MAG TPA: BREX-3 system phosphatase PglZ [Candidatus Hydrogenedentes bacterium]|nr:BREX-3 system phosphatase PglZ [Candidatus Hydrogenedentota bacterium]
MNSWREHILNEFTPNVARLTLVADPDGLLLEEKILQGVRERGFELLPFEDHIAFRYAYESKFRSRWDHGEYTDLVVVLRSTANDLGSLPYDLLQAGRKLAFNLGDIFPNLSYPVVAALDRGDLDAVYEAQRKHAPGQLGDNATKEFILRHAFEVAPELIKNSADLLRALLRRHYQGQQVPSILDKRFIQLLRQNQVFNDWPLEELVPNRETFFSFLQERWPIFLDYEAAKVGSSAREDNGKYGLAVDGPVDLPFGHHDIRVYVDNLFTEGFLRSVPHERGSLLSKTWVGVGIKSDPSEDRVRRLSKLLETVDASIPALEARHGDWFRFAHSWAELIVLVNEPVGIVSDQISERIRVVQAKVDAEFCGWLSKRYAGLVNLPPTPPTMLHHVPSYLAHQFEDDRNVKIAMVVLDGLSMDQWLLARQALEERRPSYRFNVQAVFAWVPSLTSVSRQAAFAGKPPFYFPGSIESTDKESTLWTQFWADRGYSQNEIVYAKALGEGTLEGISEVLSHPKTKIAGLVIDKVDRIIHGMELGTAGMHNQVRQWARLPYLDSLLEILLARGFRIYLTSDHGNIEARGCGRPAEGSVADLRGERVRIYPNKALLGEVRKVCPLALEWEPVGLPDAYFPLIAPHRKAFVPDGKHTVSHGGISIEEVIVPFIQIERRASEPERN